MPKGTFFLPEYVDKFHCIGPACEDSCCVGWRVDIDEPTYNKYQSVPPGPLRVLIVDNILRTPEGEDGKKLGFAQVKMGPSRECPFHNAERLCQIQVDLGEECLSQTCASYPRQTLVIDNLVDRTLTLSCPEACRLVLLSSDLLANEANEVLHYSWNDTKLASAFIPYFWPIREFAINLIRNRTYPLWQRMFLLGTFSRRLEAAVRGEIKGGFSAILEGFSAAVGSASLRGSIETISADLTLQLGMVMELVRMRENYARQAPRLVECIDAFARGVGEGPGATLVSMSTEYGIAYERYFAPFFEKHPYILENYLINMILRRLFPFGAKLFEPEATLEPAKEYALLATDFALIKGLLIGVAGAHKEAFSTEHVVQTVQAAFKHFEHNSEYLVRAHQVLVDKNLNDARGLTMLLRN